MGLTMTIALKKKEDDENTILESQAESAGLSDETDINLTDFTVTSYCRRYDSETDSDLQFQPGRMEGLELWGDFNAYDKSKEVLEVEKLAKWSKNKAHDPDAYRTIEMHLTDNNNKEYETITLHNAFIVSFKESYSNKNGNATFYAFIREFDDSAKLDLWDLEAPLPPKEGSGENSFASLQANSPKSIQMNPAFAAVQPVVAAGNGEREYTATVQPVLFRHVLENNGYKVDYDSETGYIKVTKAGKEDINFVRLGSIEQTGTKIISLAKLEEYTGTLTSKAHNEDVGHAKHRDAVYAGALNVINGWTGQRFFTVYSLNNKYYFKSTPSKPSIENGKNYYYIPLTKDEIWYYVKSKDGYAGVYGGFHLPTLNSESVRVEVDGIESSERLQMSSKGLQLLAEMEVNTNSLYMVKEGEIIKGIITHDVGDGGLTVGYGYFIKGGMSNTKEINRLKDEFGINVKEGEMVEIDKVLKLYYEAIKKHESRAKEYVNTRELSPNEHEFDALVIQAYNGTYYDVMDAFGDTNLDDTQALERALQRYRTLNGWERYKNGWTNRLRNIINLYRHGNYTKLY